jgi:hypothetical protein
VISDRAGKTLVHTLHQTSNASGPDQIAFGSLVDSANVNVSFRERSGLKPNLSQDVLLSFERDQRGERRCERVRIPLLVVMDFVTVQKECRVIRDVHPIYKAFGRKVRCGQPKWRVGTHHLKRQMTREKRDEVDKFGSVPP